MFQTCPDFSLTFCVMAFLGLMLVGGLHRAVAQEESSAEASLPYLVRPAAATGVVSYGSNRWGIVQCELINPRDQEAEVIVIVAFEEDPNLQYGRKVWMPSNSRLMTWVPILPPERLEKDSRPFRVRTRVILANGEQEVELTNAEVQQGEISFLQGKDADLVGGLIVDQPEIETDPDPVAAFTQEAVAVARVSRLLPRSLVTFSNGFLPPTPLGWDGLDHLALASDRILEQPAAVLAIRQWVQRGGRLWILLDQVNEETVQMLLGDANPVSVIRRDRIVDVQFTRVDGTSGPDLPPHYYPQPLDFVRVIPEGADVIYEVNGWPALIQMDFGRGSVLFTTLSPEGWLRLKDQRDMAFPRNRRDAVPDPRMVTTYMALPPADELAERWISGSSDLHYSTSPLAALLVDEVGYQVADQVTVLTILGGFCGVLVLIGIWLSLRKSLEWLALASPLVALVTAGGLMLIGSGQRSAVPSTAAVAQVVYGAPNSENVSIDGVLALYSPTETTDTLGGQRAETFRLDFEGIKPEVHRLVWTDIDDWHWDNVDLPAGFRTASFQAGLTAPQPFQATATFGPNGLTGNARSAPFPMLEDAVVDSGRGRWMSAQIAADGKFTADASHVLNQGVFIDSDLMDETQRRRQNAYRELLAKRHVSNHPMLLGWSEPYDLNWKLPGYERVTGSSLLLLELQLQPTPRGSQFVVPSPFVDYAPVPAPGEQFPSGLYSAAQQAWAKKTTSSDVWLRFELPETVQPARVEEAKIKITLAEGSLGAIHISGVDQSGDPNTEHPLISRTRPPNPLFLTLNDPQGIQPDESGGIRLHLKFDVNDQAKEDVVDQLMANRWEIENISLELRGQTLDAAPDSP